MISNAELEALIWRFDPLADPPGLNEKTVEHQRIINHMRSRGIYGPTIHSLLLELKERRSK